MASLQIRTCLRRTRPCRGGPLTIRQRWRVDLTPCARDGPYPPSLFRAKLSARLASSSETGFARFAFVAHANAHGKGEFALANHMFDEGLVRNAANQFILLAFRPCRREPRKIPPRHNLPTVPASLQNSTARTSPAKCRGDGSVNAADPRGEHGSQNPSTFPIHWRKDGLSAVGILARSLAGKDAWSLASTCWDLVVSALPCRANGDPNSTLTSGGSRIAATCGAALRCGIHGAIVNELAAPYFSQSFLFTEQPRHFQLVLASPLSGKRCRLSPCALRRTTMRTFACAVDSLSTIGPDLAAPYKHNSSGVCNFEGMDADPDHTILASIRMKSEQQNGVRTIADRFSQTQDKVGVLH